MIVKEYGYDTVLDSFRWKKDKGKFTESSLFGAHCLRSGRDTLKAIAIGYKTCVDYLPALISDIVISPFVIWGHKVRFYRLNEDYSINIDDIHVLKDTELVLFLYISCFGIEAICDSDLEALRKEYTNIVFIEDRTHCFLLKRQSSFSPDYIIVSLRTWTDISDGGLLLGKVSYEFETKSIFSEERLKAQCIRHEYLKSRDKRKKRYSEKVSASYLCSLIRRYSHFQCPCTRTDSGSRMGFVISQGINSNDAEDKADSTLGSIHIEVV